MPSTSAIDSEMKSIGFLYCRPGWSRSLPPASCDACVASPSRFERLKPNMLSTQIVMTPAPMMSSTALMICTHVVPFMPP